MDFYEYLVDVFPNTAAAKILETIEYVESDDGCDDPEEFKLERMISLLLDDVDEGELLDEAAGISGINAPQESSMSVIVARLTEMLPKVDPSYLEKEARSLVGVSDPILMEYVNNLIDKDDYPTIGDYNKRKLLENSAIKYTKKFIIEDFLNEIPDPLEFFGKTDRKHSLNVEDASELSEQIAYATVIMQNHFNYLSSEDIVRHLKYFKNDIVKASAALERLPKSFRNPRARMDAPFCTFENKLLLQELAYVQNKTPLRRYIKFKNKAYKEAYQEAKAANLLETCQCCSNDELLPEECYFCVKDCVFCKECIKQGTEIGIGEGNLTFPCFNDCNGEFTFGTLQMVLDPTVFHHLMQRKQMDDLQKADLADILLCTFCNVYLTQQNPDDKIFVCKNVACLKETCLECGYESHVPLRCNEIERDEHVKRRTYIENKMTEALLRTCNNCNKKLIKESGCNKMTCSCGTTMCYYCGASNITYSHFGILPQCPLHNDLASMHRQNILDGANTAKRDLGVDKQPGLLRIDPTEDLNA